MHMGKAWIWAAIAVGVWGCSSSSGDSGSVSLACGSLYDQISKCGGGLPADELARLKPRYQKYCESEAALPGSGMTAATITQCAQELAGSPNCSAQPASCTPLGKLGGGAACNASSQCQSGSCGFSATVGPGGTISLEACGTCDPPAPCGDAGTCPQDQACVVAVDGTHTCQSVALGDVGAQCSASADCKSGLFCKVPPTNFVSGMCTSAQADGAACQSGNECTSGFCTADGVCGEPTYVKAGEACGTGSAVCLVGFCPSQSNGVCPTVIADGQACDPTDSTKTCDTLSTCTNGTCSPLDANVCK
jgi:hypothetical protein